MAKLNFLSNCSQYNSIKFKIYKYDSAISQNVLMFVNFSKKTKKKIIKINYPNINYIIINYYLIINCFVILITSILNCLSTFITIFFILAIYIIYLYINYIIQFLLIL